MNNEFILAFENVSFAFPGRSKLFQNLSIEMTSGDFVVIQGPSGAGKTSLLRLINRLEEPSSGRILFKGRPLSSYHPPVLRRSLMYVQQTPTVLDGSVRKNLLLPFAFKNNQVLKPPDDRKLQGMLAEFLLSGVRLSDNARNLSVGQQQRLCFIRGLLLNPEVLLLDEPTSALDPESSRVVEMGTERMNLDYGLTVIMITHKPFQAGNIKPVLMKFANGRVKEEQ